MGETFGAASHDEVLQLAIQVALLLGVARLFGAIAVRLGQPGVVGEIAAGVILGPSLISEFIPAAGEWILPQTEVQGHLLEAVGLIGVMLLLVVTGLETDLGLIRRRIGLATGVSIGSLVLPFAGGLALGYSLPDDLLGAGSDRTVFALFLATALSISAIPVLARILIDLGLMRREIGQTMLAAGMINDIVGWTLLGIVSALATADTVDTTVVGETVLYVIIFIAVTALVGPWLVGRSLAFVQDRMPGRDALLTLVIVLAFVFGAFSQALHLEPVIGAFAVGILFGRVRRLPADVINKVEAMTMAVFAPIFFAIAGLKVDLGAVLEPRILGFTIAVIAVATVGKVMGAYLGARLLAGQDHWTALAYGWGLNARGALEIIIASIGLSLGILSLEMFSIVVVMAIATSLMAPFGLRSSLARVRTPSDETERLERGDALRGTFTGEFRRALIPVRPRAELAGTQRIQAWLIRRLTEAHGTTATLLSVVETTTETANDYLAQLKALFGGSASTRVVQDDDSVKAILDIAHRDYDVLMIGTPTMAQSDDALFGRVIDDLVKLSPVPTIIVRGDTVAADWEPRRIVVPLSGASSSRRAADFALVVARPGDIIIGVHVITTDLGTLRPELAFEIASEFKARAARLGHTASTEIREAPDVETGILEAMDAVEADLLILGTGTRAGTTRLFLGHRVEQLARRSPCPVVIVNA